MGAAARSEGRSFNQPHDEPQSGQSALLEENRLTP